MSGKDDVAKMTFEQAMGELEEVVSRLDGGDVPLDESIRLYERGARLKAHCDQKLREAEEKVEAIALDASGQPTGTRPAESP